MGQPKCDVCGTTEDVGGLLKDLKNLEAGFKGFYCRACVPAGKENTNEHGTLRYPVREIPVSEVAKFAQMINPDISCDFCETPDPQWLFDLHMDHMNFYGHEADFGDRWTACDDCVTRMESGKMPNRPGAPPLGLPAWLFHLNVDKLHGAVIDSISNKRPYVRSDADGRVKFKP